jgi:hypothetical protein
MDRLTPSSVPPQTCTRLLFHFILEKKKQYIEYLKLSKVGFSNLFMIILLGCVLI